MNGSPKTGKKKALQAVSDSRGVIAAVAIDQRSALRNLFASSMGVQPEAVPADYLIRFKEAVSRILTPHASAILLDPEYGLPAAGQRAKQAGLLLAYEKTGYDKRIAGRLPNLLDQWSVRRLAEAGADCIKILLYYSKSSSPELRETKQAFVERVGAECAAEAGGLFGASGSEERGICSNETCNHFHRNDRIFETKVSRGCPESRLPG